MSAIREGGARAARTSAEAASTGTRAAWRVRRRFAPRFRTHCGMCAVLGAAPSAQEKAALEGVDVELFVIAESLSVVSGGVRRDSEFLGTADVLVTLDMEHLAGWRGGTFFLYGIGTFGDSISAAAGDLQAVSNIEGPETFKLFEAWYEQQFAAGEVSVLAGLFDVNSEFDVIPAAGLFLHSAHGMGSDFGSSGLNGPSTFPVTSLATRVQVQPSDVFYARAVVADGVPGDLDDASGTEIEFESGEGLLIAGEVGWYNLPAEELRGRERKLEELPPAERRYGDFGKYALGVWGYTTEFTDYFRVDGAGDPRTFEGTFGAYALAEQRLSYEQHDPFQGLSAFARVGVADDRANLFDGYVGAGVVYRGPFAGRDNDRLGFTVVAAHLGGDFRTAAGLNGSELESWEVALELTYRAALTPWLSVQPDLQYVIDPGGDPTLGDAFVAGLRLVGTL